MFWSYVCVQSPGFLDNMATKGKHLKSQLKKRLGKNPHVKEVWGQGSSCWNSTWCSCFTTSCSCSKSRPPYSYCRQGWCCSPCAPSCYYPRRTLTMPLTSLRAVWTKNYLRVTFQNQKTCECLAPQCKTRSATLLNLGYVIRLQEAEGWVNKPIGWLFWVITGSKHPGTCTLR